MPFILLFIALASTFDPAESWLTWANLDGCAPDNSRYITHFSVRVEVPSYRAESCYVDCAAPAFWPGIEPAKNNILIQPILKLGSDALKPNTWQIFNEFFRWNDSYDFQSNAGAVEPGNQIDMEIVYDATTGGYKMTTSCAQTGFSVTTPVPYQGAAWPFCNAYLVLEHQPRSCSQYPASRRIAWQRVLVAFNDGKRAPLSAWRAHSGWKWDACNATTRVDATTIETTWLTK